MEKHTHLDLVARVDSIGDDVREILTAIKGKKRMGTDGIIPRIDELEIFKNSTAKKLDVIFTEENSRVWQKVKLYITRLDVLIWVAGGLGVTSVLDLIVRIGPIFVAWIQRVSAAN